MITLYGISRSRTFRCLWMLEELGVAYQRELVMPGSKGSRLPDYMASINPNGHVPTLRDGDLVLWESMAINLYLAEKYGAGGPGTRLWPETVEGRAQAYQWSHWVMCEVDKTLLTALYHRFLHAEADRDEGIARESEEALAAPFAVLDDALGKSPFLLGEAFSVADLNVASVMYWAFRTHIDLEALPALKNWLGGCLQRPAAKRAMAARESEAQAG